MTMQPTIPDRSLLLRVGTALYGPYWHSELARSLKVADRTVRRWISGAHPIPAGIYTELVRLAMERAAELEALADELRPCSGDPPL